MLAEEVIFILEVTGLNLKLDADCNERVMYRFSSSLLDTLALCFNLLATDFFFQILAHPVFKM